MLLRIHDPDRGASITEYGAIIALVAALVAGIAVSGIGQTTASNIADAVASVFNDERPGGDDSADASDDQEQDQTPDNQDDGDGDGAGGGNESGDADGTATDEPDQDDGCGWNLVCHGGNAVDAVGTGLSEAGDYLSGIGESAWSDVQGLADALTSNPVDTLSDIWDGVREDPLSLLISPETREAWNNGEYARSLGMGTWDIGSWFIPVAGWATKAGKLGTITPNGPSGTQRADGSNQPSQHQSDGTPDNRRGDDENRSQGGCPNSSFAPGTPVLLANGDFAPIESIELGDEVWATDPHSDTEGPREVIQVHNDDAEQVLVEITVTDDTGQSASVSATAGHPFWVPERATWVEAVELDSGNWLRTSDGSWVTVTAVETHAAPEQQVHNLTIDDLHTYHVAAGDTEVLVSNCDVVPGGVNNLSDGVSMTTRDALDTAEEFLGPGYRELSNGRYVSADGLRQVRMTDRDLAHPNQAPHMNFETYNSPTGPGVRGSPDENIHVYLPEE